MTKIPVYSPPSGDRTPLELFTALLDTEPVIGNAWINELATLAVPMARSSWVASTVFPSAGKKLAVTQTAQIRGLTWMDDCQTVIVLETVASGAWSRRMS